MPSLLGFTLLTVMTSQIILVTACYDRISSSGVTEPYGDIFLPLGSDLVINCSLHANYTGPSNSSDIGWLYKEQDISSHYITILDGRSAQLHLKNLSEKNCGNYICRLNSSKSTVCLNTVFVGRSPPKPEEIKFSCKSMHWKSMTCTWKSSFANCAPMNWTLSYDRRTGYVACPKYLKNEKGESYGCVFDEFTNPPYDLLRLEFAFRLFAQNKFNKSISHFRVNHFSRVVPSPPTKLVVLPMGSTKCRVVWEMEKKYNYFCVPLVYNLEYRSQWDLSSDWHVIEVINQSSYEIENLVPYTNYFFRIRVRSKNATDEDMWSSYVPGNHQTSPAVPTASVVTTSSNFIDINVNSDMDWRNVTIFWQPVPPFQYFGPQFHYIIKKYCQDENVTVHTANATEFLFKFYSLQKSKSYRFEIQAGNQLGVSQPKGTIFVPKSSNKPPEVEDLTLILYGGGVFKVSWKPPDPQTLVSSYSLVWCKGKAYDPRLDPCYSPLNWTKVMGNETSLNVTLNDSESSSNYRFGVAVNSRNASSGLTWSKCIAPHNGVLSKMKMLPLEVKGPNRILVSWILDCSERLGIVTGFQVQYCLSAPFTDRCKDGELKKTMVRGADKKSFLIDELKPFSNYSVTVAGVTEGGVGEPCDPQTVMTDEGAPSDPSNLRLISVTNQSISIRWDLPSILNGVLTRFLVTYQNDVSYSEEVDFVRGNYAANLTKNIECYTNYTIAVQACTRGGCSDSSKELMVMTGIGVPGQPEALKAREFNDSHILIEWEAPEKPNGPINEWNLLIMEYTKDGISNSTMVMTTNPFVLPMRCNDDGKVEFGFAVQAVIIQHDGHDKLIGPWTDTYTMNLCYPGTFLNLTTSELIGAVIGGFFILLILIVGLFFVIRRVVGKIKKMITVPIPDMPDGLGDVTTKYSDFKSSIQHPKHDCLTHNQYIVDLLSHKSVSSDEGRGSQSSTETTLHLTSSLNSLHDEILNLDKTSLDYFCHKHNLSSDSSGCSTGDGSVSSSLTTRIHLSSDSGTEVDFPGPPYSPDSVFFGTDVWPTGVSPVSNCQLRLRTNNNNLQRLGEEENDTVLSSGDRIDLELAEKIDSGQPNDNHYCKAAINRPELHGSKDIISVALEQDDNVDHELVNVKSVTNTDTSPLTVYSRVGLVLPLHPTTRRLVSGTKELDTLNGTASSSFSDKSGANTNMKDTAGAIRPSSYVTLSILTDTSGKQKSQEGLDELLGEQTELIPYSCVGLVGKPQPKICSGKEILEKSEPISHRFMRKKENGKSSDSYLGVKGAAALSVPCPAFGAEITKPMPSKETGQKTNGMAQKKPKSSPYITLSGLDESIVKNQCPGYSKVGQPEQTPDNSASRGLPNFASYGKDTNGNEPKISRNCQEVLLPAGGVGGYVTLGLMDPRQRKEECITTADESLRAGKLSFDPALNEEPLCDGSSWESELEISEENLTEEDLHAIALQPSTSLGYVCVGVTDSDVTKNYVAL